MEERTVYTVASSPDYWGPECKREWSEELAEALAQALREYAAAESLNVEVRVVPETMSYYNRSTGDESIILILDAQRDRLFSGPWEWARNTRAWQEWR